MSEQLTAGADESSSRLREVRPSYVYQQVAHEIERYIFENNLKTGDLLPSERELCAQLGTSRPTLREALRTLELVGLVEVRRGGRTAVGAFDLKLLTEWIGRSIPKSNENLRGLLEVRDVLEVRATELAAPRITDEQLDRLVGILARTEAKVQRGEEVLAEDVLFHDVIFEACGNAVLQHLLGVISGLLAVLRQEVLAGAGGGDTMLSSHRAVYEGLRAHDPESAGSAMRDHIRSVIDRTNAILNRPESNH